MTHAVEAVFENGVLKPMNHLDLVEHQKVQLLIEVKPPVGKDHRWHWREAQSIDDGFSGSVANEVVRQRCES